MTCTVSRRLATSLASAAALAWFGVGPAFASEPTGTWQTGDGRARIRTEHCGSSKADLCGYVVWLKQPQDDRGKPRLDVSNSEAKKRNRPLLGHELMVGLKLASDERYEGNVYNADNGKLYQTEVWSERPAELSLKGCVAAVFCETQTWQRVNDNLPGQLQGPTDTVGGPRSDH